MLTAPIIYIPGTGGSFLYRILTLSEHTAFGDTESEINFDLKIDPTTRLSRYLNWNSDNWKLHESKFFVGYKKQLLDFYHYENTSAKVIATWHPTEFIQHDRQSLCWQRGAWPAFIFINVTDRHKLFLLKNQQTKFYHLDWDAEISAMQAIREEYVDSIIDIEFDDFFKLNTFLKSVEYIDKNLQLNLDFNLVELLWQNWHSESQKTWK